MIGQPQTYKGLTVPYLAAWQDELDAYSGLVALSKLRIGRGPGGSRRVSYVDETAADRWRGVLWARTPWSPGHGIPAFGVVHPLRQRRLITRGLCQVCTGPADVWMMPRPMWEDRVAAAERANAAAAESGVDARAPIMTPNPPVCRACADVAAAQCPELGTAGFLFVAPASWAIAAVYGTVADDSDKLALARSETTVPLPGAVVVQGEVANHVLDRTVAKAALAALFDVTVLEKLDDRYLGLGRRRDVPRRS